MKKGKAITLALRRKREGRTDYKSRLKLLSSRKTRVVIRKMLNNFTVQLIQFDPKGDKVLLSTSTRDLIKFGWKGHRGNISAAYLVGLLCGKKAVKKGFKLGIADFGLSRIVKGTSYFAVIKGLKDAGFEIPAGEDALPDDSRITGKHIQDYAIYLKDKENYNKQFSQYLKQGIKPEELTKHFEEVKNNILKDGAN